MWDVSVDDEIQCVEQALLVSELEAVEADGSIHVTVTAAGDVRTIAVTVDLADRRHLDLPIRGYWNDCPAMPVAIADKVAVWLRRSEPPRFRENLEVTLPLASTLGVPGGDARFGLGPRLLVGRELGGRVDPPRLAVGLELEVGPPLALGEGRVVVGQALASLGARWCTPSAWWVGGEVNAGATVVTGQGFMWDHATQVPAINFGFQAGRRVVPWLDASVGARVNVSRLRMHVATSPDQEIASLQEPWVRLQVSVAPVWTEKSTADDEAAAAPRP